MAVLDFEAALAVVLAQARTLASPAAEAVALLDGLGRVLAAPILADRDQPPFDRATRDGYALRAPGEDGYALVGELRAGQAWQGAPLGPGKAIAIMTGAPLPAGAEAVVMIEHTRRAGDRMHLAEGRTPGPGDNVVPRGAEARQGTTLLPRGTVLSPAGIAIAAACGAATVEVFRKPEVAIVATGDELVELDRTPAPEQIRNSNSYTLAALVAQAGGVPRRLPIAADTPDSLRARLAEASGADLLLLSGGVSMGAYDLVEQALVEAGAEFLFTGVRMQPGKPVVFGRLPSRPGGRPRFFFGLPGNPISTQVTFLCFALPLLRALGGALAAGPRYGLATLAAAVSAREGVTRLLPGRRDGTSVGLQGWQGSGDQAANARADCYVELLPGRAYRAGEPVRILPEGAC